MKMFKKIGLAALCMVGLFVCLAAASGKAKLTAVYRGQETGTWQVFLFGVEPCVPPMKVRIDYPIDPTKPLEIECYYEEGK